MKRLTQDMIQQNLKKIGMELMGPYTNTHTPILVKCKFGHIVETLYHNRIRQGGCQKCELKRREKDSLPYLANEIEVGKKKCRKCEILKSIEEYTFDKVRLDLLRKECTSCESERNNKHYLNNTEYHVTKRKKWENEHPGYFSKWKKDNKELVTLYSNNRRATELHATPKWLSPEQLDQILNFYKRARFLTETTGIKHVVDHIMPLKPRNKLLCGLHVPWNLQVITHMANSIKSDKC